MNNINFLRETLQNYIQFGVKLPINYMQMNGKEKNGYVIWRGFDPMILISSRDFCMKSKLGFYVCVVAWVAP